MNRGTTALGAGLLLGAILVPTFIFGVGAAQGGWEAIVFGFFFTFIISPIMGIVGLVLLIVGLASGGGQHQQQQVVVHVGGAHGAGGVSFRCAHCGGPMGVQDSFCNQCGTRMIRG